MIDKVKTAENIARAAHEGQMYGDERPYIEHVEDVVHKVKEWYPDWDDAIAVAWLHDVIEDTDISESYLIGQFGFDITDAVILCTDPPGENRKQKKAALYQNYKFRTEGLAKKVASVAKCADRYANQNNCLVTRNVKKAEMYIKEFPTFMRYFGSHRLQFDDPKIWDDLFGQYGRLVTMVERTKAEALKK